MRTFSCIPERSYVRKHWRQSHTTTPAQRTPLQLVLHFSRLLRIHARAVKERYLYVRLGVQTCQTPPNPSPVVWPGPVSPE